MTTTKTHYYQSLDQLPAPATSQIKAGYLAMLGNNNRDFFSPLAHDFPLTFQKLANSQPVQLMELVLERTTGMGQQVTDYLYAWSVVLSPSQKLILNIPRYAIESETRANVFEKYYSKLPSTFHNFYRFFDGGKFTTQMTFDGTDFPNGYDDWTNLHAYYVNKPYLQQGDDIALEDVLPGTGARVLLTLRNQDFIVCLLESEAPDLFLVKKNQPAIAEKIVQPEQLFDNYLQRCLTEPDNINISFI